MTEPFCPTSSAPPAGHVIIAGFGIVGRAIGEVLKARNIPFVAVELNAQTVARCTQIGLCVINGNILDETIIRQAGIERAILFAVALPDDHDSLKAVELGRRLNPKIPILARCVFSSAGLKAAQLGAQGVVVAEQAVARDFAKMVGEFQFKNG